MEVKSFTFNDYQENTYLIIEDSSCIIIDPGNYYEEENNLIMNYIEKRSLNPQYILITHTHIDHILGINFLSNLYSIKTFIPKSEIDIYNNMISYASMFGMEKYKHEKKVNLINESSNLSFGKNKIKVLSLPGHSPGHIAFFFQKQKKCFCGDVIFKNSIGRTDLPGGDFDTLINSIKKRLFLEDENTILYPGHGPITTISDEKENNPFLN
tara:strand:+ start:1494 stop:2126 length:633 start_codon:yes stop_codon:yes gene_type:complete